MNIVESRSEEHPFVKDKKIAKTPLAPKRSLPRKDNKGEDYKLEYGLQDTFLADDMGDSIPPIPFHGGKPLQPIDRVDAENQEPEIYRKGATEETQTAARRQRFAIQSSMKRRNASRK